MADGRPAPSAPEARWVVDGRALFAAARAATARLAAERDAIDALNVYPVADGDTGSNMLLTMQAALARGAVAAGAGGGPGPVAAALAAGALLEARGNSGVILSQIVRGVADAAAGRAAIDGRDLARALRLGQEHAYRAVLEPVEGTILTTIRVAADRAEAAAVATAEAGPVLAAALAGAREALAATPDLLDVLRRAGVVDAGGLGLVRLLEGIEAYARGEETDSGSRPAMTLPRLEHGAAGGIAADGAEALGYCTNFLVAGDGIDADAARRALAAMGGSAVIVGDARLLKVHLHTEDPGAALSYGARLGRLDQVRIDDLRRGVEAARRRGGKEGAETGSGCVATSSGRHADRPHRHSDRREESLPVVLKTTTREIPRSARNDDPASTASAPRLVSVVAVAAGDGLAEALRSMGAELVVGGNPSVADLVEAVGRSAAERVLLLPNNPNILLAAREVAALSAKPVEVVPSRSVPHGLAALQAFNPDLPLDANAARMARALERVRTVAVGRAIRDAEVDGVAARAGDAIGLLDDRLAAAGDDIAVVLRRVLDLAGADGAELITLFPGAGADDAEADGLRAAVASWYPGAAVDLHPGGQPHYRYLVAVE